jgi:hypothetical protein
MVIANSKLSVSNASSDARWTSIMPWTKPVFGLNSVGEMYIIYGSNILRQTDVHAVCAALQKQGSQVRMIGAGSASKAIRCANAPTAGTRLHDFECWGISEIRCESFHQRPTHHAHWANNVEGYDDDQFQTS